MRRAIVWLTIVGLLLGPAVAARAGWVWNNGRWLYVDPTEPRLPSPETPAKMPPKPIAPTPRPKEPAPPPTPGPETPALPKVRPPAQAAPAAAKEPAEPKPPISKRRWWERAPDPNADKVLFDQATAKLDAGRLRAAENDLKKLIKKHPESAHREEAIWLRAGALFERKEYYKAYEQYEALITQYAGSVHYRDALLKEIEIAELFLGPVRRRILGIPLLSGEAEAVEILRRVYEHQPAGDLADDVILRIADYYGSKRKWTEAEDYYDKYCREYPNGDAILHAELQRAKCAIERCRGPRYDVTSLRLAYDRLRQYQEKFPDVAEREGVAALLTEVRDMQAQSLYEIAARYRRADRPVAAAFYAERLRERYADSPWSEKAGQFLATPTKPEAPAQEAGQQEPTQ